jgi:hypothetical protein
MTKNLENIVKNSELITRQNYNSNRRRFRKYYGKRKRNEASPQMEEKRI